MGCGTAPKVTYWTGTWDPGIEAISKEITSLRVGPRRHSPVVSFSQAQRTQLAWQDRVLILSGRRWLALRAVAAAVEPRGDVTHVFGGQVSWHLLRALGRRPILLTAVVARAGTERLPDVPIARVAVETDIAVDEWVDAGVPRERIQVIHPGIDLDWYRPTPLPVSPRFSLLFASTPSDPSEIGPRGIPLLVELARLRPDIDIVVPWRNWGDVTAARRAIDALLPTANFVILYGDASDMRVHYARAHATIACFTQGVGKSCPNFVLEGLAMGRPCISTAGVGISKAISRAGAGLVAEPHAASIANAADSLRAAWPGYSERSRKLAEQQFDLREFRARYEQLYGDIHRSQAKVAAR